MKKLVYLFVATFATSLMISCGGKTTSSDAVCADSTVVADTALADTALADTAAVDSLCVL